MNVRKINTNKICLVIALRHKITEELPDVY